jgi:putative hemolysin
VESQDPLDGLRLFRYLQIEGRVHPHFQITPKPGFTCLYIQPRYVTVPFPKPPIMMEMYFRYNALFCSYPVIDREFKTIDFLVMMDAQNLNKDLRKLLR